MEDREVIMNDNDPLIEDVSDSCTESLIIDLNNQIYIHNEEVAITNNPTKDTRGINKNDSSIKNLIFRNK